MNSGPEEALRRCEGRLHAAEERLRLMDQSVKHYSVFHTDEQGVVTYWSKGAEEVFGYAELEILGWSADTLFTPEDREAGAPQRELAQAVVTGHGEDVRWHLRKDGTPVFLNGITTPLRDAEGGLRGFAKVARDITQRELREASLRDSEGLHRAILESISDAFFALDRGWRFTYVNRHAEALLGRTRSDLLGKHLWEEFAPAVGTEFERSYRKAMDEGVRVTFEAFYPPHDRWYEVQAYPSPEGLSVYFRGVNERKRAEAELRASEDRRRLALDSAELGTWSIDSATNVLTTDDRFRTIFLGSPAPFGLEEAFAVIHPEDRERVRAGVAAAMRPDDPTPYVEEYRVVRPDGTSRWVFAKGRANFEPTGAGRRLVSFDGTLMDITEKKRSEAANRAARDEAEAANRAKDQFLAVLSHELRTPLNPILLAASAMLERTPEPEEVRPTFEMIRQNVRLQARLIDDLLDVMPIVQGKMPLHWGVSDCHDLIGQSIDICRSEFLGKAQELVLDLAAEDHQVNADSARLHQVLWNLVRNAVKFTPEGGSIVIRTRNDGPEGRNIVVEVADTGIGIEADVLPNIWDPFQQGETTITRRFGGLGLGLAICKGVVDAHGGTLAVESEGSGRGTTFRVMLKTVDRPMLREEVMRESVGRSHLPPLNRLNILVVEDEAATLRLMARLLAGLGHRATAAGTLADAWVAFQAGDFDLIISDIGLPDGTGLDLMRKVKAVRRVPAIALTGYGMDEDVRRSREAGFTTHMTKPIDFTKLEAMIRQVAD